MPFKVITREGKIVVLDSPLDFERVFPIRYLSSLQFADAKVREKIEKRCEKALLKQWITPRQKWLGHYYAEGIRGAVALDLTIRWLDDVVGYGVWTNRAIPANAFIGEYVGLLRKRRFWKRWENLYCFDYMIGPGRSSSVVIDCQDFGNHTRFINHSNKPNLEPVSVYCDGLIHVIFYARTAIPRGVQLCYDYGEDYWEKRRKPVELLAATISADPQGERIQNLS
jgi:hypothetical protein